MINASFDADSSRQAAISGVYQYDTGQRLRLNGLPSPSELAGEDDFLEAGAEIPVVQVHFGYYDDSQAEMRLAVWQENQKVWTVEIPDEYLTRVEAVHMYVYVYHGETEYATRARTMYEGVFTPIPRPAPSNVATPEQWEAWEVMLEEINLAIDTTGAAEQNALDVVASTNKAAQELEEPTQDAINAQKLAEEATKALEAMGEGWEGTVVTVVEVAAGSDATIAVEWVGGVRHITLGVPNGAKGATGATGATGPSDISFSISGTVLTTNA